MDTECYDAGVKLVVQVKLLPDAATEAALRETLKLCNQAACHASRRAHATGIKGKTALQRLVYDELKAMGPSAQPTIHCVRKVAGAYAKFSGNLKAGNYGPVGSARRARVEGAPVRFRKDAAQPFDDRSLSWRIDARTVSIWTVRGRRKSIPLPVRPNRRRCWPPADEASRTWCGAVAVSTSTPLATSPKHPSTSRTDSPGGPRYRQHRHHRDGTVHTGKHINQVRHRNRRLRSKLQAKGTKSAKRLLRHLSGREARFAADTNHRISKQIVTEAQRTTHGIALEDLGGIRARVRLRKPQRVTLHTWSFAQLGAFIAYKAKRAGVPVVFVDPRHTSQGCSACGHINKKNRPDQATFKCTSCGFAEHADVNAARNIAARGAAGWAVSHAADDAA